MDFETPVPAVLRPWIESFPKRKTVWAYSAHARRLAVYLPEDCAIETATADDLIVATDVFRATEDPSASLWNQTISAWRSAYKYLHVAGLVESNPAAELKRFSHPSRKPSRIPTFAEIASLWNVVTAPDDWRTAGDRRRRRLLRDRALLATLIGTAMRIGDALALDVGDFDIDRRIVRRGDRPPVRWPADADQFFLPLLHRRRPAAPFLFSCRSHRRAIRLSADGANLILGELCVEAEIDPPFTAESFRRFAFWAARGAGASIYDLRLLGGEQLSASMLAEIDRLRPRELPGLYLAPPGTARTKESDDEQEEQEEQGRQGR